MSNPKGFNMTRLRLENAELRGALRNMLAAFGEMSPSNPAVVKARALIEQNAAPQMKTKAARCVTEVPATLSPTEAPIRVGTVLRYRKEVFANGEHWLLLGLQDKRVPSVFFDTDVE